MPENSNRPYFLRSKLKSKLLRISELNFKMSCRSGSEKKFGGVHCWIKVCMGNDKPQHIAECFGYESHINPGHTEDKQVEYLKDLHIEVGSAEEG